MNDLAVIVWLNPEAVVRPQKRLLETLTTYDGKNPVAFSLDSLKSALKNFEIATEETIQNKIMKSTKDFPLVVPLPLAISALGWTEFHIIEEHE